MRKGEIVLELGDQTFTGRMPIPALEFLQDRTDLHPLKIVRAFEAEEDKPSWSDFILIAGLSGGGMDLALAEQIISGEQAIFVPYSEKRLIALALLLTGLYAPASGKVADDGKKPKPSLTGWILRSFTAMRSLWASRQKSAS